ncbi:hypothetical protein GCM10011416_17380 [Polaribacter pacificus]|uniref:Uncharacterized protein n=1 Tax=Polaribacter pacificus TaxID=1775173 RepID=A0A917HZ53_9FLAO|nr:hypothetical protein [Polaribacter pacificus]GGG99554.1 hypothetical protein GCM10011416_17380 [Polaribacter pacificus]
MKTLIIVEELGDISVSAAIANWSLITLLSKELKELDILTLDNTSKSLIDSWDKGRFFFHKKNNLTPLQKRIRKNFTFLQTVFQILSGNSFEQYNRIKNIRFFLNNNTQYNKILLLSGGLGFAPHQSVSKIKFKKNVQILGVFHDPYPSSSYPEPYKGGNYFHEYFKRRNLQQAICKINHLIFPSKKLYEWYLKDYKINSANISIIPHAVKFNSGVNIKRVDAKNEIIITHTGTLLKPRNPLTFLKVFYRVCDPKTALRFYGPIHKDVNIEIKDFNKKNIQIVNKRIPYNEALDKLNESSFLLLVESGAEFSPFLPTKFVDYINIGKPIIVLTPEKSEISRLLGEDYPFKTTLNNEKEIEKIIANLENDELIKLSLKIINELKEYFSEEYILKKYLKILSTD